MGNIFVRDTISNHRSFFMGLAIVAIIINHARFFGMCDYGSLNDFVKIGTFGVEIFLFVSSFGLYFAFKKNNNLPRFYYRRLVRILPAFIVVVLCYYSIFNATELLSYKVWIRELFVNWYITFILAMYLLFPFLYVIQQKFLYLPLLLLVAVSILLTSIFVCKGWANIQSPPLLMAQRLPVFGLGMLVADERFKWNIIKRGGIMLSLR